MKVIFLDIDGVMKTLYTLHFQKQLGFYKFYDAAVKNLNKIIEETGAKIVISSSWRSTLPILRAIFELNGIDGKHIIDMTPVLRSRIRGEEIQAWLDTRGAYFNKKGGKYKIEKFIIIDDDNDMGQMEKDLVQTIYSYGIDDEVASLVIRNLLSKEENVPRLVSQKLQRKKDDEYYQKLKENQDKHLEDIEGAKSRSLMTVGNNVLKQYEHVKDFNKITFKDKFREVQRRVGGKSEGRIYI